MGSEVFVSGGINKLFYLLRLCKISVLELFLRLVYVCFVPKL